MKCKDIKIIVEDRIEYGELQNLFKKMDKANDIIPARDMFHYDWRTMKRDKIMLKNSVFINARNNKNEIVGSVRIVTDKAYTYYITDVMVIPERRKEGIATKLMSEAIKYCKKDGFMKIFLATTPNREEFYRQIGFKEALCRHFEVKFKKVKKYL